MKMSVPFGIQWEDGQRHSKSLSIHFSMEHYFVLNYKEILKLEIYFSSVPSFLTKAPQLIFVFLINTENVYAGQFPQLQRNLKIGPPEIVCSQS